MGLPGAGLGEASSPLSTGRKLKVNLPDRRGSQKFRGAISSERKKNYKREGRVCGVQGPTLVSRCGPEAKPPEAHLAILHNNNAGNLLQLQLL